MCYALSLLPMQKIVRKTFLGHPNSVCDMVAEAIVDECLRRDPKAKVAIRVLGGHGAMMVSGQWSTRAEFDVGQLVKKVYAEAGYTDEIEPFIHLGAPRADWLEARQKGLPTELTVVKGYATSATREGLPSALVLAREIARKVQEARLHDSHMAWLRPDGYAWVAMEGSRTVQMGVQVQHAESISLAQIQTDIFERLLRPLSSEAGIKYVVNPQGVYTAGGFLNASGQSGIEDDWYGGLLPIDSPIGLDGAHPLRAGTFMARFLAKKILAEQGAKQVWVQWIYSPGHAEPSAVQVLADAKDISESVKDVDLRAEAIAETLQLCKPIYRRCMEEGLWEPKEIAVKTEK